MSTRATYEFVDADESFTVYKHFDGYEKGGLQWIARALNHAWPLPRFEAEEFAAAFIVGNKTGTGGVYLSKGKDSHGDTEYHYTVKCVYGKLFVSIEDFHNKTTVSGFLDDLLDEYAPTREWVNDYGDWYYEKC